MSELRGDAAPVGPDLMPMRSPDEFQIAGMSVDDVRKDPVFGEYLRNLSGQAAPAAAAPAPSPSPAPAAAAPTPLTPTPTAAPMAPAGAPGPPTGAPTEELPPAGAQPLVTVDNQIDRIRYFQSHKWDEAAAREQQILDDLYNKGQPFQLQDGTVKLFPLPGTYGRKGGEAQATSAGAGRGEAPFSTPVAVEVQRPDGSIGTQLHQRGGDGVYRPVQLAPQLGVQGGAPGPALAPAAPGAPPPPSPAAGSTAAAPSPTAPAIMPAALPGQEQMRGDVNKLQDQYNAQADTAQERLGTVKLIQDLAPKIKTGWTAETRQDAAKILSALGVSEDNVKAFTAMDPAAGDVMNKQFVTLAAQQTRLMGAREPGSIVQLFRGANPNFETQPEAVQLMGNVYQGLAQRALDVRNHVRAYTDSALDQYQHGRAYVPPSGAAADADAWHPVQSYIGAAMAKTNADLGRPWLNAWGPGTYTMQNGKVVTSPAGDMILSHIPSGTNFMGPSVGRNPNRIMTKP
jgi:hypothetical protein